jgi:hypothetical protein
VSRVRPQLVARRVSLCRHSRPVQTAWHFVKACERPRTVPVNLGEGTLAILLCPLHEEEDEEERLFLAKMRRERPPPFLAPHVRYQVLLSCPCCWAVVSDGLAASSNVCGLEEKIIFAEKKYSQKRLKTVSVLRRVYDSRRTV